MRRLRGRLASPVTVWTAGQDHGRAGLTVSSLLVADGEPGVIVGVLDSLAEFWDVLRATGRGVVNVLGWRDRQLGDAFGYVAPAPGGPFRLGEWQPTEWGPALTSADSWAGCRLVDGSPATVGWGLRVELVIEHVVLAELDQPLVHRRGRYRTF